MKLIDFLDNLPDSPLFVEWAIVIKWMQKLQLYITYSVPKLGGHSSNLGPPLNHILLSHHQKKEGSRDDTGRGI